MGLQGNDVAIGMMYYWLIESLVTLLVVLIGAARINDMVGGGIKYCVLLVIDIYMCFFATTKMFCTVKSITHVVFLFQAHAPFEKLHDMKYDPKANTQEFTIQVLNRDHYIYSSIAKQE